MKCITTLIVPALRSKDHFGERPCLKRDFECLPRRKSGLRDHDVSVYLMCLPSNVTNAIRNEEENDTLETILNDKQSAIEGTQEVIDDKVRLVRTVKCSSEP